MKYLLDTHTWVWWHMSPENLSTKVKKLISDTKSYDELLLASISVWEFSKLLEKGRLIISYDPEEWLNQALEMVKFRFVDLTPAIAYKSTILPGVFHGDPVDQIIVATAREENATIFTKDKTIQKYKYVKTVW